MIVVVVLLGAVHALGDDDEPLYPIFENGLWGLIDASGNVVLAPKFEQIGRGGYTWIPETWDSANPPGQVLIHMTLTKGTPVTDRVIPVRFRSRFALAKRTGEILIHGKYQEMAGGFSEGLLMVKSGSRFGYVDEEGELVIPARWEQARIFRGGYAFVMAEGRWGIIDRTGNVVVEPRWDQVEYTREWTPVRQGKDWGVVDLAGKVVIPVQYDEIRASPMGPLVPVHDNGRILYLRPDGAGTVAFEFQCTKKKHRKKMRALGFFGNRAALVVCGERYGVIDESGKFVLEPEWEVIQNFRGGIALVRHKGKKGLINESGKFIVELEKGLDLWDVAEEEIGFSRGGEHGFFNRDGRVLRTFKVDADHFGFFQEGLAVARKGVKDGYIDKSGSWVIEPRFHKAEPFHGPLAVVAQPVSTALVEIGYIDRESEAVYKITLGGFIWPEHLVNPSGIGQR